MVIELGADLSENEAGVGWEMTKNGQKPAQRKIGQLIYTLFVEYYLNFTNYVYMFHSNSFKLVYNSIMINFHLYMFLLEL